MNGLPQPLPEALVEQIAGRFGLLAEPMRIRLLDLLREREEASVGELAGAVGASHANVSRHLNVLHRGGVLERRRHGNQVIYRIADPTVLGLCEQVCGGIQRRHAELGQLIASDAG